MLVTILDLISVLSLHTSANTAVDHFGNRINNGCCIPEGRFEHGCYVADTSQTLKANHRVEETVITLGVLNLHLVLQQVSRGQDRICEAAEGFETQAHLRALFLATTSTARECTLTARVKPHISVQSFDTIDVRNARRTQGCKAAKAWAHTRCFLHFMLPIL